MSELQAAHKKGAKLKWSDLWNELGMERDRAGRWYPGEDSPEYVRDYLDGYRGPSRAYPKSYATALLTAKFAKKLCEFDPDLAVRLKIGRRVGEGGGTMIVKRVVSVEMASDEEVYSVTLSDVVESYTIAEERAESGVVFYELLAAGYIEGYFSTRRAAMEKIAKHAVDDDLVIGGYGKHGGRKFWRLPERLKKQITNHAFINIS